MSTYYSNDGGASWEGPLDDGAIAALKAAGLITADTLIRQNAPVVVGSNGESIPPPPPTGIEVEVGSAVGNEPAPTGGVSASYFILQEGVPAGPYLLEELQRMYAEGRLQRTDFVLRQGSSKWVPFSEYAPGGDDMTSLKGFSISRFFSDIFKHHDASEAVDLFCAGSSKTTPPLHAVPDGWPTPWLFARLMLACVLLYFGLLWALDEFDHFGFIPSALFIGNFAFPFCLLVLFYEMNIRRDVPFYTASKALLVGGVLSLVLTTILNEMIGIKPDDGYYWAGPIEEPAKLLAVILIAGKLRNGRILTGLLLGAAVGAGFEAMESAAYAFYALSKGVKSFIDETNLRAILTIVAGHTVWTAITAGAFWLTRYRFIQEKRMGESDTGFALHLLTDSRFLKIAIIPVLVHAFWNSPLMAKPDNEFYIKCAICGIVTWVVAFKLVAAGLRQVREEKYSQKG